MKRRAFISFLGCGVIAAPFTALAQPHKPATLGILVARNPYPTQLIKGIKEGFRDLGYVEGTDIIFELRTGGADVVDLAPLASELIARKVDILFAYPTLPRPRSSKPPRTSRSLSCPPIQSAPGWSRAWPGLAAISPVSPRR
jgi:hypothetical protein